MERLLEWLMVLHRNLLLERGRRQSDSLDLRRSYVGRIVDSDHRHGGQELGRFKLNSRCGGTTKLVAKSFSAGRNEEEAECKRALEEVSEGPGKNYMIGRTPSPLTILLQRYEEFFGEGCVPSPLRTSRAPGAAGQEDFYRSSMAAKGSFVHWHPWQAWVLDKEITELAINVPQHAHAAGAKLRTSLEPSRGAQRLIQYGGTMSEVVVTDR